MKELLQKLKKPGTLLLRLISVAAVLASLAVLWVVLIVAEPQPEENRPDPVSAPLVNTISPMNITAESDLYQLLLNFPSPVMSYLSGSGMTFVSGDCRDFSMTGGYGRIVTLKWRSPEGTESELVSVYPATAVSAMGKRDYSFSNVSGPSLCGQNSVRMENEKTIRLHMQTDQGLYYVTISKSAEALTEARIRSIQLFSVSP